MQLEGDDNDVDFFANREGRGGIDNRIIVNSLQPLIYFKVFILKLI